MLVHKVQETKKDEVVVSFRGHFHYDQAYVTLSWSRKMNGIQFIDFDPKKMRASPAVTRETNRLLSYMPYHQLCAPLTCHCTRVALLNAKDL